MKLCTSCSAQFEDQYKRCLHCGAKLQLASASDGGFGSGFDSPTAEPELVLIRRGSVAEIRQLSQLMDRMSILHQVEVDGREDSVRGAGSPGSKTTLSLYAARHDEERAKQALQTLALGEFAQAEPIEEAEDSESGSALSRHANLIGNAIGVIVTVLILLGMVLRALTG